ncbi:sugar ABC transporter permease [Rubellimicrobium aerolatum]|uniref:Xylose transport system permease protein XylH n=1 Tax=Rubellimicrobium aerolatum TaxID=490979 RepID=A0ABW0SBZ9_9RHOB|nr:sugar ABC transporter permease [Rubellimicrobium aerolatum]MBP1806016.1 D-xylose transport system permease protein [Rubellimicrobium aerolatum]
MSDVGRLAGGTPERRGLADTLELDKRLFGMVAAFVLLCLGFWVWTGGTFLSPRNIFNIAVQTVAVGIMATGMVFVIVTRQIDLSVGALLAMCSATMAMTQAYVLPGVVGLDSPLIMPVTVVVGLVVGTAIGALHGWLIGYQGIPSFIVTLGGLFVWRNLNWYITNGQSVALTNERVLDFGGTEGVLGRGPSWVVGGLLALGLALALLGARRAKRRHGFAVKPAWAEGLLIAVIAGAVLGFVAVLNAYPIAATKLRRQFEARGEVMPEGFTAYHGLPVSVLLLIVVAAVMTVVARRTRFGRYIFATGGNPDAAELSGINTRWLTVKVFALMGFLCGLAALVSQARLQSHGNDIGTLDELRVIAAAVIGGTALAGGIGTIYGAILGALIMQSLQSGMGMVGVDTPFQNIVVGAVLVVAVWIDTIYRKRTGALK